MLNFIPFMKYIINPFMDYFIHVKYSMLLSYTLYVYFITYNDINIIIYLLFMML